MRFLITMATVFAVAGPAFSRLTIEKYAGKTTGKHIVQLKDGVNKASLLSRVKAARGQVTHEWTFINGFAGLFDESTLAWVVDNPDVKSVSEDGVMHISGMQANTSWGISRISNPNRINGSDSSQPQLLPENPGPDPTALIYDYYYPNDTLGSGVDIYFVDTGVRISHEAFVGDDGSRAVFGWVAPGYQAHDGNGHGTHVAGIAAGKRFGVAQKANIIAVKAMDDNGSGAISDIISGLDYVTVQAKKTGRPSVVNMSIGGLLSPSLNDAVAQVTQANIHVVVAAGNNNNLANLYSPASAPSAVTVAASDIEDERAYFSNYGPAVDIFAPGVSITSAWSSSDNATNDISGTSMAAPHVAGLIAYLIAATEGGDQLTPANMTKLIQELSLKDVLSSVPPLTSNYLAQNHKNETFCIRTHC